MSRIHLEKLPALVLAIGLQLVPVARLAVVNPVTAPPGIAVVCRLLIGAAALLGGYHTVSGASAAIAGLANTNPRGPVTSNVTATVSTAFSYRIIVTNPGVNPSQAYYNAAPLPPGLTINTNIGGNGLITGTPTTVGVYPVTLTAGNANSPLVVYFSATINIVPAGASPPTITTPPTNQTASVGGTATFSVVAGGIGPLGYQWRFGSTAIAAATNATLTLSNVQSANAGTYSVVVSNAGGSVSAQATLTVGSSATAPTITAQPQDQIARSGTNVTFTVTATGTGLAYQWQFNGTNLPAATAASLTLTNVTAAQSGAYAVQVSSSAGSVMSRSARLLVITLPNPSAAPTLHLVAGAAASLELSFAATAGYGYVVEFNDNLATTNWVTLTNFPPAFTGSTITLPQPATTAVRGFYRVSVTAN